MELGTLAMQNLAAGGLTLKSLQLTANIKLVKWAPQNDVLGHPSCEAVVAQAGLNASTSLPSVVSLWSHCP